MLLFLFLFFKLSMQTEHFLAHRLRLLFGIESNCVENVGQFIEIDLREVQTVG